jgi:cell division protein FtsB
VFFVVAIFLTSIFGQNGFIDLRQLTREKERLLATTDRLDTENRALHRQISRLKHDRAYIEALARRELGVVGKDELVIHWHPVDRTP